MAHALQILPRACRGVPFGWYRCMGGRLGQENMGLAWRVRRGLANRYRRS